MNVDRGRSRVKAASKANVTAPAASAEEHDRSQISGAKKAGPAAKSRPARGEGLHRGTRTPASILTSVLQACEPGEPAEGEADGESNSVQLQNDANNSAAVMNRSSAVRGRAKYEANGEAMNATAHGGSKPSPASVDSAYFQAQLDHARLLESRDHVEEAIKICHKAISMCSMDSRVGETEGAESAQRKVLGQLYSRLGSCYTKMKAYNNATAMYEKAVSLNAEDAVSLHGMALVLAESSRTRAPDALILLRNALQIAPDYAEGRRSFAIILTDVGVRLKNAGLPSDAIQMYREALSVDPGYAQAYYNLAVAFADVGLKDRALEYYALTIDRDPAHAEALCNAGVLNKEAGNLDAAIAAYERALAVNPNFTLAKANLAIALCDAGTAAKLQGNKKETFHPTYADAHYNLGVAYAEDRKLDRAVTHYELAVKFNANHTEAHNNLGVVYKELGNLEQALESYKAALASNPQHHQTHNNIAVVYTLTGNADAALEHLNIATTLEPTYAEANNNIGVLLRDQGDVKGAIRHYERCVELDPLADMAAQNRLHALNYLDNYAPLQIFEEHCKWGDAFQQRVNAELATAMATDVRVQRILSERKSRPDSACRGAAGRPLRVGYLSPDFFTHSVSYFVEALVAGHSVSIEVYVYSNVAKEDAKTRRLQAYPNVKDRWREVTGLSSVVVGQMVLDDEIDVLVELAGHTAGNRLDVMALRLAPVQVTWIGYPNTTGLPSVDYRVTDAVVDPLDTTQAYIERLWRLPRVFLCYVPAVDAPESVAPVPLASSSGVVTLGSFNILAKMQGRAVRLWARLLKTLPNARLLLKAKPFASASARQRVQALFAAEGVDTSRLDMIPLIPATRSHLEAYTNVDIALDPFPYAGTTTTCEALYMGCPIVTLASCAGASSHAAASDDSARPPHFHAHDVGVTLLSAIGHTELIARSEDEYVAKVVALASDSAALTALRSSLRETMMRSPLGDAPPFVREVEGMFFAMWAAKGGRLRADVAEAAAAAAAAANVTLPEDIVGPPRASLSPQRASTTAAPPVTRSSAPGVNKIMADPQGFAPPAASKKIAAAAAAAAAAVAAAAGGGGGGGAGSSPNPSLISRERTRPHKVASTALPSSAEEVNSSTEPPETAENAAENGGGEAPLSVRAATGDWVDGNGGTAAAVGSKRGSGSRAREGTRASGRRTPLRASALLGASTALGRDSGEAAATDAKENARKAEKDGSAVEGAVSAPDAVAGVYNTRKSQPGGRRRSQDNGAAQSAWSDDRADAETAAEREKNGAGGESRAGRRRTDKAKRR